ncbi:MAG: efflux RND transporter periplasmic adaptor subunit, partial [Rhodospirillales bacterium]|nr:efflux RND transporter periplasmic adaptor subunit [Rhodospirillales bacterium]
NEQVELKSETDGTVQEINFEEGQPVDQGRLLVALDATKFAASLAEAEANHALSKGNLDRAKQLLGDKLISQQEYDQTAASFAANEAGVQLRRRQLQDARIYAPFSGIVSARMISPGQVISRNTTLTWLVDLDPLKVEVNVPERFLSQVLPGQDIALTVSAWPGESFTGRVYFASPYVNPDTRTMLVKAELPNADLRLKPGMFAGLSLTLQVRSNAIVIPEVAIGQVLEGGRATVMLVSAENRAELRPIKVGLRLDGRVEVTEGLQEGEKVIVEGLQKIGPGMPVTLAPEEAMQPYLPKSKNPANRS